MAQFEKKEIKKRSENLSEWYTDIVQKAELADYGPVKGTMVIRPYGYAIWEMVQDAFNRMIKTVDVQNAYFPLFIPMSLLEKEKAHVEGFSPELAVVTHAGGEKLADPLAVRPTSETIMYVMFAKWIHSWRDLPLKLNQWCNVVRWEKRTFPFLRTSEFLWQEGHTAHATEEDAVKMQLQALDWYRQIYEDYFAIPPMIGRKSETEKFAGAKTTYTIEALMPDGKALQAATSHNLAQQFSKPFEIQYQTKEGTLDFVWQTSWGLSTRSLGGLFMTHGDDNGLIMPPKIAPIQVVIIPIYKAGQDMKDLLWYCQDLKETLTNGGIRVKVDDREETSVGRKFNEWEVKGVPIRYEVGLKEYTDRKITVVRRDTGEKKIVAREDILVQTLNMTQDMQKSLFASAKKFLTENTREANTKEEFQNIMNTTRGFIKAFWCEEKECEAKIKAETKATTRCLPLDAKEESGSCVYCGKPATYKWIFALSY
jgi:prolyl-tRNA synthetase